VIAKEIPLEIETYKGMKWCTKDTYICDEDPPCMIIDYVYCGKKGLIDVIIRRSYLTYYTESDMVQHKQVPLCDDCKEEQTRARQVGANVRIHYIDPPTARILRTYLTGGCNK
jgi:hypothetical protein